MERFPDAKEYNHNDILDLTSVDTVIHLACDADSRNSNKHVFKSVNDNTGIFSRVLDEAINKKVKRFIYVSSVEAETDANIYCVCKYANEKILKIAAKEYGFEYVILRPCNLYGPHMDLKDTGRNVVANFMRSLKEKTSMNILNNQSYPFTYVGVLVDNIEASLTENTNETIRVGSTLYIPLFDLAALLEGMTKTWEWVKTQKT